MSIKDKDFYNEASATKLGWTPNWFGCYEFDKELQKAIAKFQKEHKLKEDGLCGGDTFKMICTHRDEIIKNVQSFNNGKKFDNENCLQINGKWLPIDNKIDKSLKLVGSERKQLPRIFVIHWDAALSTESCYNVLKKRGLSIHFGIDNDGKIFQFMDPKLKAQHCKSMNDAAIGVEISNAVIPKYQSYYKKTFGKERPIWKDAVCNGVKYGDILGFYDEQIVALKKLVKVCCDEFGIVLKTPPMNKVFTRALKDDYSGVVCHYHIDEGKSKWDCANFDIEKMLTEMREDGE